MHLTSGHVVSVRPPAPHTAARERRTSLIDPLLPTLSQDCLQTYKYPLARHIIRPPSHPSARQAWTCKSAAKPQTMWRINNSLLCTAPTKRYGRSVFYLARIRYHTG